MTLPKPLPFLLLALAVTPLPAAPGSQASAPRGEGSTGEFFPPLTRESIETRDLAGDAQTINQRGVTLVPLEVGMKDGDVVILAKDPAYGTPGPDEAQKI